MSIFEVSRHFDEIAGEYDASIPTHVRDHYLHRRAKLVGKLSRKGHKLLEIGCGTRLLAKELADSGHIVFGLDVSLEMLKIGQPNFRENFVVGDSSGLPFRSNSFDLTLCIATLHHIAEPHTVCKSIQEMARVTKPDGRVVVIDHNPLNPYWPILMKRVPQDCGNERLIPLSEILKDVEISGAKAVEWWRTGFTPDFMPRALLPLWMIIEHLIESIPGLRKLCAHNVIVFQK